MQEIHFLSYSNSRQKTTKLQKAKQTNKKPPQLLRTETAASFSRGLHAARGGKVPARSPALPNRATVPAARTRGRTQRQRAAPPRPTGGSREAGRARWRPRGARAGWRGTRDTAHAATLRPTAEYGVGQPAGPGFLAPHQVHELLAHLGHDGAAAAAPGAERARRGRRRRRLRQPLPLRRGGAAPGRAAPGSWRSCAGAAASFRTHRLALPLPVWRAVLAQRKEGSAEVP